MKSRAWSALATPNHGGTVDRSAVAAKASGLLSTQPGRVVVALASAGRRSLCIPVNGACSGQPEKGR